MREERLHLASLTRDQGNAVLDALDDLDESLTPTAPTAYLDDPGRESMIAALGG